MTTVVVSSVSFVPAGTDCSSLVRGILDFFQAPDDPNLVQLALNGLNSGISLINTRVWHKLYTNQTVEFVAGTQSYSLDDAFKEPIRFWALDGSSVYKSRIEFRSNEEFFSEPGWVQPSGGTTTGVPSYYTIDYGSREIVLDLAPDAVAVSATPTGKLTYHRRIPKLNCTGTTGIPPEFDEFLIARGSWWYALSRAPEMAGLMATEARERWRMLVKDDCEITSDFGP